MRNTMIAALTISALTTTLSGCMPSLKDGFVVNTATGAVAGAVLANKDEATRKDLVDNAVGSVTGKTPETPKSAAIVELDVQYSELKNLLVGSGITVARAENRIALSIPEKLVFDRENYKVKPAFGGALNAISANMLKYPNTIAQIVSHSDNTGSEARREFLTRQRARAIADAMQKNGVSKLRLQSVGLSDTASIASNSTEDGREANRRVEIIILPIAK